MRFTRLALPVLLAVLLYGFAETAVRLGGFRPALPLDSDKPGVASYFWICDQKLGFRNRADGAYRYDLIASEPLVTTDRLGDRGAHARAVRRTRAERRGARVQHRSVPAHAR